MTMIWYQYCLFVFNQCWVDLAQLV